MQNGWGDTIGSDAAARITSLLSEGRYLDALGVRRDSERIDIDTASARLSQAHPELAGPLSGITQVLTDPAKRQIYQVACVLRDNVMRSIRAGAEPWGMYILQSCPDVAATVWEECERVLRCDFKKADVKMLPRGAVSIAEVACDWIIETLVNSSLPAVAFDGSQRRREQARLTFKKTNCTKCSGTTKTLCPSCGGTGKVAVSSDAVSPTILVDDGMSTAWGRGPETCGECRGSGSLQCDCQDSYIFDVPRNAAAGAVLEGVGERTGKSIYVILDRAVTSPRPTYALMGVYQSYAWAQSGAGATIQIDETLEYWDSQFANVRNGIPVAWVLLGAAVGRLAGSWQVGAIVGLGGAPVFVATPRMMWHPRLQRSILALLLIGSPILGAAAGFMLASWQIGLAIGAMMSGAMLAVLGARQAFVRRVGLDI